jgi:hypothetical protein
LSEEALFLPVCAVGRCLPTLSGAVRFSTRALGSMADMERIKAELTETGGMRMRFSFYADTFCIGMKR